MFGYKRKNVLYQQLKRLTGTGRFCYLFLCIETYLINCYPEKDWTLVSKRMWQWTSDYWAYGWETYWVVVPECLLEYDSYEKAAQDYDRRFAKTDFSEEEYGALLHLFDGVSHGAAEDEINKVLLLPIDFCNDCGEDPSCWMTPYLYEYFDKLKQILDAHHIPMPHVAEVEKLPICTKRTRGTRQSFGDTSSLSIILHPEQTTTDQ